VCVLLYSICVREIKHVLFESALSTMHNGNFLSVFPCKLLVAMVHFYSYFTVINAFLSYRPVHTPHASAKALRSMCCKRLERHCEPLCSSPFGCGAADLKRTNVLFVAGGRGSVGALA
jgi:hypothetical protein